MPDDRITREEISGPDWVGLVTGTYIPALLMHMSELEKRLELIRGIREQDSVQKLYTLQRPKAIIILTLLLTELKSCSNL
jgi:hypothetical protein